MDCHRSRRQRYCRPLTDNVLTFNANGQLATPADGGIDLAAGAIPDSTQ